MSTPTLSRYKKVWAVDRDRGIKRYQDSTPTRAHIQHLVDAGMNYAAIAEKSGISITGIHDIARGLKAQVQQRTAHAILNTHPDVHRAHPTALRDASGTRRRLRALASRGYSIVDLATRTGIHKSALRDLAAGRARTCRQATHDTVTTTYDELWDTDGPNTRTRNWATSQAWPMPLDLDDATLDDPNTPDPTRAPDDARAGVDLDEFLFLVNGGTNPEAAAQRLGVTIGAIARAAERHNRPDIARIASTAAGRARRAAA